MIKLFWDGDIIMKINKVIASAALAFAILNLNPNSLRIKAAEVSQTVKNFSAKTNVALDKNWTVKFSSEVDEKTIGDNIKVRDNAAGIYVNVIVKLNSDKKSVQIQAPSSGYGVNKNYSVLVDSKIASLNGKNLVQAAELDFTTAAIKSTDSIKDVNTTVGTIPTLPASVNATLTDGTTKAFDIIWDSLSQSDISKAGTVTLNGILKDTSYKVSININVGSASTDDANIAFFKQFSSDLGNEEAKISNSNERDVLIALKSALDAKIANPSATLNVQIAKDKYHSLTAAEQSELKSTMLRDFTFTELWQAYQLLS